MIGSLFKELSPLQNDETEVSELTEDLSFQTDSDDSLLASLPVVQKIVRRRITLPWHSETSDLVQGIVLRLLKWRDKYREKSAEMSPDEWQSFAAQTTYNEINRHFAKNQRVTVVPIETVEEIVSSEVIEGTSDAEVSSLARIVWQKICGLSLRQRQALLFSSQELVVYLLKAGITDEELAENLNLTAKKWAEVKDRLPLKDFQIGELLREAGNPNSVEAIAKSMKKARHEARAKVRRVTEK